MVKLSKGWATLCSILFFFFLILLVMVFLVVFIGDGVYRFGRLPGLIVFFFCVFLTRKFYDKIKKVEN